MDTETLKIAIDSSDANGAAKALAAMAESSSRAEAASTSLARAMADQGKALSGSLVPASKSAALSFKDLASAQAALGPAAAKQLAAVVDELGATETRADSAAAALKHMGDVAVTTGAAAHAALLEASNAPITSAVKQSVAGALPTAAAVAPAALASGEQFLQQLTAQAATAGKTKTELLAMQAAELGVSAQAQGLIAQIASATAHTHEFGFETAAAKRELLVLGHELSQGNFKNFSSSLLVLGERTGAAALLFNPLTFAIGATVASLGALALAYEKGAAQSKAFADAITSTGNFAGQTEGSFNALAKSVAASTNSSIGSVRDFQLALIATGQIGPQVFDAATVAAVGYAKATGKTADQVAADFAKLSESPSKFAANVNQSFNFITAAQLQMVKSLEDTGRAADAQSVVYDALNARFPKLEENIGTIERALRSTKNAWHDFWDAAADVGRQETPEDKIKKAQLALERGSKPITRGSLILGAEPTVDESLSDADKQFLNATIDDSQRDKQQKAQLAFLEATGRETQKAGIAARTFGESQLAAAKDISALNKALSDNKTAFENAAKAGVPFTDAQEKTIDAETRKRFAPAKAKANDDQKPTLDNALKQFKDNLQAERDALAFHEKFLQGEYAAGNVSLVDYYDDRRASIAAGVAAEISELDKEKARIAQDQKIAVAKNDKPEVARLQGKIDEATSQQSKLAIQAARDVDSANQTQRASYKQLSEAVANYRADLLQLEGDEIGAARLRSQQQITSARVLVAQSQGGPSAISPEEEQSRERSILANQAVFEAKTRTSQINEVLALEEDRIALAQKTGAITEIDALQATGDARKKVIDQLDAQVKDQERIAALPENALNFKMQLDTAQARQKIEEIKADLDPLKKKFDDVFKDSGANALADLLNGTKSFKAAATDFLKSIGTSINNTIAKNASETFFGKDGPGSNAGSLVASLFGKKGDDAQVKSAAAASALLDTSPVAASLTRLQTSAVDPLTDSFARLLQVINAAPDSIGRPLSIDTAGSGIDIAAHGFSPAKDTGEQSISDLFKDTDAANAKAAVATDAFGKNTVTAAADVLRLAESAGKGNSALGLLPSIIQLIQAAATTSSASGGSGGGLFGGLASLFGGGSGAAAGAGSSAAGTVASDEALALFFHSGGVVGVDRDVRPVHGAVFDAADRYHTGGVVGGGKSIASLMANEVPAILMGGPKGTREEVLHANDPRHHDNIAPALLKVITDSQGQPVTILSALAADDARDKPEAPAVGAIARMFEHDKETHQLSPLTRYLIGSPSTTTSIISELAKEADFESVTALRQIKMGPARADGGPVWPNTLHPVNERGPELLEMAGNQYLMTGGQAGNVVPAGQSGPPQRTLSVVNHFVLSAPASKQTQNQIATIAARSAANALSRGAA